MRIRYPHAAVRFVRREIAAKQELQKICENMLDFCQAPNRADNMSIIIVALLRNKTKEEWYDMIAKRVADDDAQLPKGRLHYSSMNCSFLKKAMF
jgi:serine/threonine protein phosphatase PrpC